MLYSSLDLSKTVDNLISAASRALGGITSKYFTINGFDYNSFTTLYESLVIPILTYASGVWGIKKYQKAETIQHRAMRIFLGVNKVTPISSIYADLGWMPIHIRTHLSAITLWNRLCLMDHNRLTRKIFVTDHQLSHQNYTWNQVIKRSLEFCGLLFVWDNFNIDCIRTCDLIAPIQSGLTADMIVKCKTDISEMSKLNNFKLLQYDFSPSTYITKIVSRKNRSYFAKLRMGTLQIQIERGRYKNIPQQDRLCNNCNLKVVEHEIHFLFICERHQCEREKFYSDISLHIPNFAANCNIDKFLLIMNSDNHNVLDISSKFIKTCFNNRL